LELPINHFKRGLYAGIPQIGFWSSLASHVSVEIMAGSGFDWLLLDTEHSPNEISMVYSQLQACMENKVQPIVRPPWNDMVAIKRFLDAGVQTLLLPTVQNAEEARYAVSACRYPPRGVLGFAGTSRSSRFGRIPDYHARCENEICVLVQIETEIGVRNLDEIVAVEGVDGVFVGPGDLSAGLGYLDRQLDPKFKLIVEDVIRRIKAGGKAAGILTGDGAFARRCLELGALFVAVGSDSGLLARGTERLAKEFKSFTPGGGA
jgi:4-hydroxy-2-oxoheptanedioate aldolase